MMKNKIAWGVVNKGSQSITERLFDGEPLGNPAIFKTRSRARNYVKAEHRGWEHKVSVVRVCISKA